MRKTCLLERLVTVVGLLVFASGCQQSDQTLPFELAEGEGATVTISTSGGTISVPPSFSLSFPTNSVTGSVAVTVTPRIAEPFPSDMGFPVPGSAFDIGPVGTMLASPARVQLAVPAELLAAGDEVRLLVALLRQDGSVATFGGSYDVTNGILTADIDELGPVAAVVSIDALPVGLDLPPTLGGGSIPPSPAPPSPSGAARSSHGGVEFSASCSPEARQCFTSGLIRVWADHVVRERLGDDLFLLGASVNASLDFVNYDQNGVPLGLVGSITVDGDLRARLNRAVASVDVEDGVTTGPGTTAVPTTLQIVGNVMFVGQTTNITDATIFTINDDVEFGITDIGTTEMLTIRVEVDIDFKNDDGSVTVGQIVAHIRLRR